MSLNPKAKPFSFNVTASAFTPKGAPSPADKPSPAVITIQKQQQTQQPVVISLSSAPAPAVISLSSAPAPAPATAPAPAATASEPFDVKQLEQELLNTTADDANPSAAPEEHKSEPESTPVQSTRSAKETTTAEENLAAKKKAREEKEIEEDAKMKALKLKNTDLREHLNLVFIGHVDAGKSTLSGQLLLSTGQIDERTMQKFERESKENNREGWAVAYIMDCSEEERERGKTVEVARAHFETKNKRYTVLDAPGHKAYVPNMIGGASQADVAVLVISARKGEFETGFENGGQTREHTMLAKTLGVGFIIIAINKMDDSSVQWKKERYDEIVNKLTPFLKSVGYNPKKQVKFVPLCGLTGVNVLNRVDKKDCTWWNEGSFVEMLDTLDPVARPVDGPVRIPIIDRFKEKSNTVILGKVESGTIFVGQKCVVMPNKSRAEIISIKLHETDAEAAKAGDNVQLVLKGDAEIPIGSVICDALNPPVPVVQEFVGQFVVLDKPIFSNGYKAMLHIHTTAEEVTVSSLMSILDKKTGQKQPKKPMFAKSGDVVFAKMMLDKPICMEKYDVLPQLGRFTVREEKTVLVGKIMMIKPIAK